MFHGLQVIVLHGGVNDVSDGWDVTSSWSDSAQIARGPKVDSQFS